MKNSIYIYIKIRNTALIVLPFHLTTSHSVIQHDTIEYLKSCCIDRNLKYLKEVNISVNYLALINRFNDLLCEDENSKQKYLYPAVIVRVTYLTALVVLSLVLFVDIK